MEIGKYPGLDTLLNVNLNSNAPALDPLVYDIEGRFLSQDELDYAYNTITRRLLRAGFYNNHNINLISPYPLHLIAPGLKFHVDKMCGDSIYLLTFSADGQNLITPPFRPNSNQAMTWDEYVSRIMLGEKLHLMNLAPWAQAKFINVKSEN